MAKGRFIAGAVCPECQALDRLVMEGDERRCVACGFQDQLGSVSVASVPRGKPEKPPGKKTPAASDVTTVKIIDPTPEPKPDPD